MEAHKCGAAASGPKPVRCCTGHDLFCCQTEREQLTGLEFRTENGSRQGQNLALTGSFVPTSKQVVNLLLQVQNLCVVAQVMMS